MDIQCLSDVTEVDSVAMYTPVDHLLCIIYSTEMGKNLPCRRLLLLLLMLLSEMQILVTFNIKCCRGTLQHEAQLPLRNRASATYFFVAKLISIA